MEEKMERAGTATFFQRFELTERLQEMVIPFLQETNIVISEYGQNIILGKNGSLAARLKRLESKKSPAALMVKFAPDFVCYAKNSKTLFFMDIKTSLTPVLFQSQLHILSKQYGQRLQREQVGLVEREAWENYNNRYPSEKTTILMACPYNPKLLLMEWVSKVKLIFRFKKDINENAAGSKTPHVNIDLNAMRALSTFINEELGGAINQEYYDTMINYVKSWPLSNPGRPWMQFNACVRELQLTCPWIRQRNKSGYLEPENPGGVLKL